jgi:hypothetical protein
MRTQRAQPAELSSSSAAWCSRSLSALIAFLLGHATP